MRLSTQGMEEVEKGLWRVRFIKFRVDGSPTLVKCAERHAKRAGGEDVAESLPDVQFTEVAEELETAMGRAEDPREVVERSSGWGSDLK